MRGLAVMTVLCACSVPPKEPELNPDGGIDAPSDASNDVAPDTTITSMPPEFSPTAAATFKFTSDDVTARFDCSIDGDSPVPCMSPYMRMLGDGAHTFSVRAVNTAGNSDDTPAEAVWSIDTVAPDTQLTQVPPVTDNSVSPQFSFTSPEHNVVFDCAIDNGGYVTCTSGQTYGPFGDGTHTLAVRAHDRAGNVDSSPAIYAWTVDTSMPDTLLLSGPSGSTSSTSASFTFVSPDAGAGATFQCSLDGVTFASCTSPRSYTTLAAGSHTFAVRVRDAVGNLDPTPATRTWIVDLTPPTTTILTGPTGPLPTASASFTFTSNEADATFECALDGAAFAACTSPASFTSLAQGAHTFSVRAIDAAGHVDASPAARAWTVDTVAPNVTITAGPANASVSGPRVTFAFTVSDGAVACSVDAAAFTACASPMAFNLPAGPHSFAVRATDTAGNVTTVTRSWTVTCAAPTTAGAAALLHLDDTGQTLANAVTGGASATLGDDITAEPGDPTRIAGGRFDTAFRFTPTESDHIAWPAALGAMSDLTIELWASPDSPANARDILVSGDGRVALRVIAGSPTTVQFTISVVETGTGAMTRIATSAAVDAASWHHVLVSLQEPTLRLWVDGVRTENTMVNLGTAPALDTIRLGGDAGTAYSGSLDEVWIAQTAITLDEAALARYCPL